MGREGWRGEGTQGGRLEGEREASGRDGGEGDERLTRVRLRMEVKMKAFGPCVVLSPVRGLSVAQLDFLASTGLS